MRLIDHAGMLLVLILSCGSLICYDRFLMVVQLRAPRVVIHALSHDIEHPQKFRSGTSFVHAGNLQVCFCMYVYIYIYIYCVHTHIYTHLLNYMCVLCKDTSSGLCLIGTKPSRSMWHAEANFGAAVSC